MAVNLQANLPRFNPADNQPVSLAQVQALIADATYNILQQTRLNGVGSPEGIVTATVGAYYYETGNGVVYYKRTGSGNTGWFIN